MSRTDFDSSNSGPDWGNNGVGPGGCSHSGGHSNNLNLKDMSINDMTQLFEQFLTNLAQGGNGFDQPSMGGKGHGGDNPFSLFGKSRHTDHQGHTNSSHSNHHHNRMAAGESHPGHPPKSDNRIDATGDKNPTLSSSSSVDKNTRSVPTDRSQKVIDEQSGARIREATTSQTSGSDVKLPEASSNPEVVREPIRVKAGETFDGGGKTYTAGSELGDGGQSEDQKPLFILEDGASLKNVIIGDNGADGVHVYGDANVDNVHWTDVGEDALTIKPNKEGKVANVNVTNSSAQHAHDKIFQMNADANIKIDNFRAEDFGNFLISNGHQQGNWDIDLNNISLKDGKYSVVNSFNNEGTNVSLDNINMDNVKRTYVLTDNATMNVA